MLRSAVLISVALGVLTACGGSSNTNDAPESKPTPPSPPVSNTITISVIDGYLSDADVCVIKENTSDCTFIGTTDEHGKIAIADDLKGQLVATVQAGKSKDSDRVGFVPYSYQMIANISTDTPNVISPYTTLAVLHDALNMDDIAAQLNLPLELITGNYLTSSDEKKSQVHILARAITTMLADDINGNDAQAVYKTTISVNQYIVTDLINQGIPLDNVNVAINNDNYSYSEKFDALEPFLESGPLNIVSMNNSYFASEGIRDLTFHDNVVTLDNSITSSYTISNDELIMTNDGKEGSDLFLYVSSSLSLSVPQLGKDLTIISSKDIGNGHAYVTKTQASWLLSGLAGQTKFLLFDDATISDNEPNPTLVKLQFSQESVTITENGETSIVPWTMDQFSGMLTLKLGDNNIRYMEINSDENITLLRPLRFGSPTLMLSDKALANSLHQRWLKLI